MPFRPPKKPAQFSDLLPILAQSKTQDDPMYQTIEMILERLVQFHGTTLEQLAITADKLNEVIKQVNRDIDNLDDFVDSINVVQPNRVLGRGFSSGPGLQEELIPGVYISIFEQVVPVTGEILKIIDVTGAGDTPFIVQNLDEARSRLPGGKLPGDYLPRAQETKLLASGYVTVTTGTGVLGSTAIIPGGDVDLPTASLGQVFISQGAGIQPIFSPNPFVNSLNASYVDLAIATGIDPAINTARLHSLDVNGFTMVEVRDGGSNVVRLASDNVVVVKVVEPAGVSRGQVLYISGAAGANPLVRLARANDINTMPGIGVALDPGVNNEFIRILVSGTIQLINTSAFAEGASLFVSTTVAGGFTTVLPDAPNFGQRIGFVTRSHATQGEILVLTTGVAAPPRLHAPTHSLGGTDPVTITALAGYPGGTVNFLRADGTFSPPPTGGLPGLHASTHQPGGSDPLVNVAWTNLSNTFTADQILQGVPPRLDFIHTGQPIDVRRWRIVNSDSLFIRALDDAGTLVQSTPLTLLRNGNASFEASVSVLGVLTATGGLGTTPLNATNLTSGTVPDARLSANVQMKPILAGDLPAHASRHIPAGADPIPNVAWTNLLNTFTQSQVVSEVAPSWTLIETDQPANLKRWQTIAFNGDLYFQPANDAGAATITALVLLRNGDAGFGAAVTVATTMTATGGLGTTPLNASNLSSGTVPAARLDPNIAYKNINNNFTVSQTLPDHSFIHGTNSLLWLSSIAAAADNKLWRTFNNGDGNLHIEAVNDAVTLVQGRISFGRTGIMVALGGLSNTPLNASQLTSGSVPDARLSSNVALKNIDNNFSAIQTFVPQTKVSGANSIFYLNDTVAPVDLRLWRFIGVNGHLTLDAVNDAITISQAAYQFRRDGILVSRAFQTSGIKFDPPVADADDRVLDAYRELDWIPGISIGGGIGSIAYSLRTGTVVKVGQSVIAQCNVILSTLTGAGSGNVTIENMPFNVGSVAPVGTCLWTGLNVNISSMYVYMTPGTNVMILYYASPATGGSMTPLTGNMLTASSAFFISVPLRGAS